MNRAARTHKTGTGAARASKAAYFIEVGTFYAAQAKVEAGNYAGAKELYDRLATRSQNDQIVQAAREQLSSLGLLGTDAPALQLAEWVRGEATSLKELKGKVVLLDFFQIICPGCERVRPHIVQMQETFGKQGLQVLGIAVAFELQDEQTPRLMREFIKKTSFDYPVAIDKGLETTFRAYGARGTPHVALIDRSGRLRHLDFYDPAQVEQTVKRLLAEPGGAK